MYSFLVSPRQTFLKTEHSGTNTTLSRGGRRKLLNSSLMNKLISFEWVSQWVSESVSEWVSERSPFDRLLNSWMLRHPWAMASGLDKQESTFTPCLNLWIFCFSKKLPSETRINWMLLNCGLRIADRGTCGTCGTYIFLCQKIKLPKKKIVFKTFNYKKL